MGISRSLIAWPAFALASAALVACDDTPAASVYAPEVGDRLSLANGGDIYAATCLACHQADGKGVPGFQPSLEGSPMLSGDLTPLIELTLLGSQARPVQRGPGDEVYTIIMPPYAMLPDRDIAACLTYTVRRWGGAPIAVTPEAVAEVRVRLRAAGELP